MLPVSAFQLGLVAQYMYCNTALQGARTVGLLEDIKSSMELAEEVLLWPH